MPIKMRTILFAHKSRSIFRFNTATFTQWPGIVQVESSLRFEISFSNFIFLVADFEAGRRPG